MGDCVLIPIMSIVYTLSLRVNFQKKRVNQWAALFRAFNGFLLFGLRNASAVSLFTVLHCHAFLTYKLVHHQFFIPQTTHQVTNWLRQYSVRNS